MVHGQARLHVPAPEAALGDRLEKGKDRGGAQLQGREVCAE